MIFQRISVARNYPAPSAILAIKRGILCNFGNKFKGRHFMGHSGTDFLLLLSSKASKLHSIVKKYVENTHFELKERGPFSNFALASHFSITRFDIQIICNILHLEMNFGNLY